MQLTGYAILIHQAVPDAPLEELAAIEDIMRHDVVHSTLDWLSPARFARAAREAWDVHVILKGMKEDLARTGVATLIPPDEFEEVMAHETPLLDPLQATADGATHTYRVEFLRLAFEPAGKAGELTIETIADEVEALARAWMAFNRGSGFEVQFAGPSASIGDIFLVTVDGDVRVKRPFLINQTGFTHLNPREEN